MLSVSKMDWSLFCFSYPRIMLNLYFFWIFNSKPITNKCIGLSLDYKSVDRCTKPF